MFEIREMQGRLFNSMNNDLGGIFRSSGIGVPSEVAHSIGEVLRDLFSPDPQGSVDTVFKKAPVNLGDTDNDRGIFNVLPATNKAYDVTDTLVVYCLGSDNLLKRLVETIVAVSNHKFRNVIFVTTKWDISVVTDGNIDRLQKLFELKQAGSNFCFLLVSTIGVNEIPVV
jgi:hypothetical protein